MNTQCTPVQMEFPGVGRRRIVGRFDGGTLSSDAGALLLRDVEERTGLLAKASRCFTDYRDPRRIEHSVEDLVAQRVVGLALRERDRGNPLASASTLNRVELGEPGVAAHSRYKRIVAQPQALDELLVEVFVESYRKAPPEIWLDLDATDDPLHGHQEGRFFHGYYGCYCYLPLYIFCGEHLLCARLRTSNQDASAGSVEELDRIVEQLRRHWPKTRINIRGDSGFCRESIMRWCEDNDIGYLLGLARNVRLVRAIGGEMRQARETHRESGKPTRRFRDFHYRTRKSWTRRRRVVGKAEYLSKGANPRFVVTNLSPRKAAAQRLYEKLYCARGEMENRIKEQQLGLFADRTSAATMRANQLRLYFASFAYVLMHALRRLGAEGTELARAQCTTLRLKLLKVGARVRITARKVWLSFSQSYPYANTFVQVLENLRRQALWNPSG